jgi:CubicO group peptidase (beta-lactamase class C family)
MLREQLISSITHLVNGAIRSGVFPGGTVQLWHAGETVIQAAFGTLSQGGFSTDTIDVRLDTIYDLASLTKVVACVPVIASLHRSGRLDLDRPICEYLLEFGHDDHRSEVTIRHVLTHTAGLPTHAKLDQKYSTRQTLIGAALAQGLVFRPGTRYLYSDVGYIILTALAEKVSNMGFDQLAYTEVILPIGMTSTWFNPRPTAWPQIAPTEYSDTSGGLIWGRVHDEKASIMGGVSGHAGLFSCGQDLGRFCRTILDFGKGLPGEARWAELIAMMVYDRPQASGVPQAGLGWRRNDPLFMGDLAGDDVFGHTGFTGTMIIFSHKRQFAAAFLSNRVCPSRNGPDMNEFRRGLCGLFAEHLKRSGS